MKRFHIWPTTDNGRNTLFKCAWIALLFGGVALFSVALGTTIPVPPPMSLEAEIDLTDSGIYVYQEYKYVYDRPNCFSGPDGYLFVNGKLIIAETRNEQTDTPWGVMYWHGIHNYQALPEGWMPYPDLYL